MVASALRLVVSDTWHSDPQIQEAKTEIVEEGARGTAIEMDIESLYPVQDAMSSTLRVALETLKNVTELTSSATECLINEDIIGADDNVQRVFAHMHDLFCQRALGDGFGAVVAACMSAFENLRGTPLTTQQLRALDRVLRKTRERPLMPFDDALDLIAILEGAGLVVEPKGFDALADFLSA